MDEFRKEIIAQALSDARVAMAIAIKEYQELDQADPEIQDSLKHIRANVQQAQSRFQAWRER